LKDETRYVDGWKEIDFRPALKSRFDVGFKALTSTTGGAGTAGYALVPIYVDPRIVDTTRKFTPLVELIPRVTNQGLTADYNKITAKGGGYTAAEDAALPETTDTYDRASTSIKFLYAVGRITGQMQAAMPSYILEGFQPTGAGLGGGEPFSPSGVPNAKQLEVVMKARELRENYFREYLSAPPSHSIHIDSIIWSFTANWLQVTALTSIESSGSKISRLQQE
jgi:hypothetical protein